MSRRDELAAVLAGQRINCTGPGEVGCGAVEGWHSWHEHEQHQADAVLAWLGEQLGDRDLFDAMVNGIRRAAGDIRRIDESRNDRRGARALDVVREWFGVAE